MSKTASRRRRRKIKRGAEGRPTDYRSQYATMAFGYAVAGYTDVEMAGFFGVCPKTFQNWKLKHPKFLHSIHEGKAPYNAKMAVAIAKQGTGYEYVEEVLSPTTGNKVKLKKWQNGNTTAAKFFLTNRMPKVWRDKHEVVADPTGGDYCELAVEIARQIVVEQERAKAKE